MSADELVVRQMLLFLMKLKMKLL